MIIALIDKYPILRTGLERALISYFEEITTMESESIALFHELYPKSIPDVIIIGVNQGKEGYKMDDVKISRKLYPKGSIIVYDEHVNLPIISQYLSMGVRGYLSKAADLSELINCVTNVLSGKKYLNGADLVQVLSTYELDEKYTNSPRVKLSQREIEIAKYLANGMKPSWISQKLDRKRSTISTIKKNVYTKLSITNVLELRDHIRQLQLDQ